MQSNELLKNQVNAIIDKRKQKSRELEERKSFLLSIKTAVKDNCDTMLRKTREIEDAELKANYTEVFSKINYINLLKAVDLATKRLDGGIKRFNRDYISIATIGKERQGKSRFLQAVGDLDNSIIPAYDATSCTGATSVIWNDPTMRKGSVRALITFRRQEELLDIVRPYLNIIDPSYLRENPLQFDEVGYINLAALSIQLEEGNANQAEAMKHLSNIVEHFNDIRDLYGSMPITLTDPELIKTYVAQNNGKSSDSPEVEYYFKYLAVSRADIYCPFYVDTGKIRLVDTVGIGATQTGIETAMLSTVDNECDAAIVVTKPIAGVQTSDVDLYNNLREYFRTRNTKYWLFYLVNLHKGRNDNVVSSFCNDVKKHNWAVADCKVEDCSNQDQVRDDFVLPMLETLIANMDDIDGAYLAEIDQAENAVRTELEKFLAAMPALKAIPTTPNDGQLAFEKGRACFNQMTAELSKAVSYWGAERNKPNSLLWNHVQQILNDIDNIVPTAEQIQEISDQNGALLGSDVWATVLHFVRNEITDRFIMIDNILEKETIEFKNSLVSILYDELSSLSRDSKNAEKEGSEEPVNKAEWLKDMLDNIFDNNPKYEQIRRGFNFLYQFEFNTRAQLIQEVRKQLYIINPICREYAAPYVDFYKPECGKTIHFYLTSRMSVIEDELRYHLSKLYRTPNQAFYAAAEEFYDRLTFASDMSDGHITSMSDIWGSFFQEYSSKIWEQDEQNRRTMKDIADLYTNMITSLENLISGFKAA